MAISVGTDCGFCASAPSSISASSYVGPADAIINCCKFSVPANAATITEIGWQKYSGTVNCTAEVGVYEDSSDYPGARVYHSTPAQVGATNEKKAVSGLSIDISAYAGGSLWLVVEIDQHTGSSYIGSESITGPKRAWGLGTEIPDPFPAAQSSSANTALAIYAVYTTSGGGGSVVPAIMNQYRQRRS